MTLKQTSLEQVSYKIFSFKMQDCLSLAQPQNSLVGNLLDNPNRILLLSIKLDPKLFFFAKVTASHWISGKIQCCYGSKIFWGGNLVQTNITNVESLNFCFSQWIISVYQLQLYYLQNSRG